MRLDVAASHLNFQHSVVLGVDIVLKDNVVWVFHGLEACVIWRSGEGAPFREELRLSLGCDLSEFKDIYDVRLIVYKVEAHSADRDVTQA